MFVFNLVLLVASLALSFLFRSKTKTQNADPAELSSSDFPMADAGDTIPIVFGERWITRPNCVWYGDIGIVPIKEKVKNAKK